MQTPLFILSSVATVILPGLIGVWLMPEILRILTIEKFGLLSLMWTTLTYLTIFEMGLSRIIVKLLVSEENRGDAIVWIGLVISFLLGGVGGGLLLALTPLLVHTAFDLGALAEEATLCLYVIGLSFPILNIQASLRAILEAEMRFHVVNAILLVIGVSNFLFPLYSASFEYPVAGVVFLMIAIRILGILASGWVCRKKIIGAFRSREFDRAFLRRAVHFGGWTSVTNLLTPILVFSDRFFLSSFQSVSALGYYAAPADMGMKLLALPQSILRVMFPIFARSSGRSEEGELSALAKANQMLMLLWLPWLLGLVLLIGIASILLTLWLGEEFATQSALASQIFLVGIFFNGIAVLPLGVLQAHERVDIVAKIHLFETVIFIVTCAFLVYNYGLPGAAASWSLRTALDFFLLNYFAQIIGQQDQDTSQFRRHAVWSVVSIAIMVFFII